VLQQQLQWQLQWQWRSYFDGVAKATGQRRRRSISGSMSCIVVVENVQNVWTAIIREVVPAIKTGPF
jgi:hypothetical protein